jgi:hypothetical protein
MNWRKWNDRTLAAAAAYTIVSVVALVYSCLNWPAVKNAVPLPLSIVSGAIFWAMVGLFIAWANTSNKALLAAGHEFSVAGHWTSFTWYLSFGVSFLVSCGIGAALGGMHALSTPSVAFAAASRVVSIIALAGDVVLLYGTWQLRAVVRDLIADPRPAVDASNTDRLGEPLR